MKELHIEAILLFISWYFNALAAESSSVTQRNRLVKRMDGETGVSEERNEEDTHPYRIECLCSPCSDRTAFEDGHRSINVVKPSEYFDNDVTIAACFPALMVAECYSTKVEDFVEDVRKGNRARKIRKKVREERQRERQRAEELRIEEKMDRRRERGEPSTRIGVFDDPEGLNRESMEQPYKQPSKCFPCFRG